MGEQQVDEVTDWLLLARSLGPAMVVEVQVTGTGRYLLCHVLGDVRLSQVPGNRLLGPRHAIPARGTDTLVRAGWLPPSVQSLHWRWTADADVPVASTACLLVATAESVLGSPGHHIAVDLRSCGESACTVHADWTHVRTRRNWAARAGPTW